MGSLGDELARRLDHHPAPVTRQPARLDRRLAEGAASQCLDRIDPNVDDTHHPSPTVASPVSPDLVGTASLPRLIVTSEAPTAR